ncbi:MAG: RNA pseudouridine synthase [Bacteroidales bacterium]|nr:RNA pseudouridine synthase [Bacteroidales bacterium]MBP5241371.1 RNA pseudouridine synthase [Bacteroidales bacterium]MBP5758159.1 RNA pseudouridine synthase [Bacteroidales bacterium]
MSEFKADKPQELMKFLMETHPDVSRNKIKSWLANGMVCVNGENISQYNHPLAAGDTVTVVKSGTFLSQWMNIVYEDRYLLVVEKKEGILTHSLTLNDPSLQNILNDYLLFTHQKCRAHVVHRLDRDTSGLLIFTKDKKVELLFEKDWKGTVYDRRYVAVLSGQMQKEGTIESYIRYEDDGRFTCSATDNGGKWAVTHYRTLKTNKRYSLVEFKLDTGRKNQIRIHSKVMGHPVVGDFRYLNYDDPIGRLGLHAYKLCFTHPVTGEDLRFETPFPKKFMELFGE